MVVSWLVWCEDMVRTQLVVVVKWSKVNMAHFATIMSSSSSSPLSDTVTSPRLTIIYIRSQSAQFNFQNQEQHHCNVHKAIILLSDLLNCCLLSGQSSLVEHCSGWCSNSQIYFRQCEGLPAWEINKFKCRGMTSLMSVVLLCIRTWTDSTGQDSRALILITEYTLS